MVFLDFKLPGIDGFKVCKLIRKYENKSIIIVITDYDSDESRRKALSAGANYYFAKSANIEESLDTVKGLK